MKEQDIIIWKDILGYEGIYQINNFGRVKSLYRQRFGIKGYVKERVLNLNYDSRGYPTAKLYKNGESKTPKIHRLVACAFLENPSNLLEINHINGIKTDNSVTNLEWCTRLQNMQHAFNTGLNNVKGENQNKAKLKNENIIFIRKAFENSTHTIKQLMAIFDVSYSAINQIKNRRAWRHI